MQPKRILHVVSAMNRGGTETLLMNIYRNIDKSRIQFDFVSHRRENCDYDDEIESLGGNVFRIGSLGQTGPITYLRELTRIMKENKYVAVHAHTDYQSGFAALAAKNAGVRKRICHSHSSHWTLKNGMKEKLTLIALQALIKYSATDYGACSEEAARFLFGKKPVGNGKVQILKNGIEVNEYCNPINYMDLREELKIPHNAKILGHVGSLSHIKNQSFILKILKHLRNEGENVVVVFVGDGQMKSFLKKKAEKLGVLDYVKFLGVRSDISNLMKALDVFMFPSLYEGFGIVTLEAQCAGTPCVVSDTVPRSTDMGLGLMSYINLEEDLSVWSEEIKRAFLIKSPDDLTIANHFSQKGFNISENVSNWLSLYGLTETTNTIIQ